MLDTARDRKRTLEKEKEKRKMRKSQTTTITFFTFTFTKNISYFYFWFSLNNSETVKAVTLVFCSIQKLFIRDIHAKFSTLNSPQSPDNGQILDEGISNFRISDQSLINENCRNSRTSNDIDVVLDTWQNKKN